MKETLLNQFIAESREILQRVSRLVIELEEKGVERDLLEELFRAVHTLKGNAGIFEFKAMVNLLHTCEDLMDQVRKGQRNYTPQLADVLLDALDVVSSMIDQLEERGLIEEATNKLAEEKARNIRNLLGQQETKEERTLQVSKGTIPMELIPSDVRRELAKKILEGHTLHVIWYKPKEDSFYKGEDPLLFVKSAPELLWCGVSLQEIPEDLSGFDIYQCFLQFLVVLEAEEDEIKQHFEYVIEDVKIEKLNLENLLLPQGDKNGWELYEDFAKEFEKHLQEDNLPSMKKSVELMISTLSPKLFYADCLKWIDFLLNYYPPTKPYIVELLKHFGPSRVEVKRKAEEVSAEHSYIREVIASQIKLIESLGAMPEEQRAGTLKAVQNTLSNLFTSLGKKELLEELSKKKTLEELISFLKELLEGSKVEEKPQTSVVTEGPSKTEEKQAKTFLKVEEWKIDRFINLVGEMVVSKNSLMYLIKKVEEERDSLSILKELKNLYGVVNRVVSDMQDAVMSIRMVPVSTVFERFHRLVRDTSKKLNKKVKLVIEGGETEADKNIIESLSEPLVHLIRNSIDHGIEEPEERLAVGKSEEGHVWLRGWHEGGRLYIEVEDDGRGVDVEKVKLKAYERGIIKEEDLEKLKEQEILNLIFHSGLSTKEGATEFSGRGVGMDVVRATVEKWHGNVWISSTRGKGTKVTMSLPLSMAVTHVMLVESGDMRFGLPVANIVETVRVSSKAIHHFKGGRLFSLRGEVIPLMEINQILDLNRQHLTNELGEYAVVVVASRMGKVGLIVDKLLGTLDVILKPMVGILEKISLYMGTAIMGDGSVMLVINPEEVVLWASTTEKNS